jgi:16S rRNA (cytidine1402-2'-O)-methyltransferase
MPGILFLIPSLLSDDNASVIPAETQEVLFSLKHFIVENDKTARHYLKAMKYPHPLQESSMSILDEHSQQNEIRGLLSPLLAGNNVGLISEAGCPAVADPGSNLVDAAHQKGIIVKPLTGPSSMLLALMGSGLNGQSFSFVGYLPKDRPARVKAIKELERISVSKKQTQLFIETPYRAHHLLEDLLTHLDKATALCIASDLTSKDEFIKTKTVEEWRRSKPELQKKQVVFLIGR